MMKGFAGIVLVMGLLGWIGSKNQPDAEKAALEAAQTWLVLVDEGKYAQSWEETASYFRGAVSQEQWQASMEAFRKPLGKQLSRNLKSQQYRTSLPGAPDGKYVVLQFQSSFESKKTAIETVTPMLDEDGSWRVAGYYIK